jgi:hypothetical protein
MTSPVFSDALALLESTVADAVGQGAVNTSPPGAVQSGIDFVALGTAFLDFGQLGGDVVQAFAQDFEAVISEALSAGILAAAIVGDITSAIPKQGPGKVMSHEVRTSLRA